MQQFVNVTLTGLGQGAVYAAFALALVLIWRSTRIVNFAQGAMAMVTTFVALTVIEGGRSYWVGFVVALAHRLVLGAVVERLVIRPVEGGPELNAVIVTLGLFVVLQALAAIIFGPRSSPSRRRSASAGSRSAAHASRSPRTASTSSWPVLVVMGLLALLFRFTDLGLRMRAAAFAPEVARLLGVRVGRMLTLGWALAAVVGSLAGLLIAGGEPRLPRLHGRRHRLRLRRRGARRARLARRRRRRRPAARAAAVLRQRLRRPRAGGARRRWSILVVVLCPAAGLFARTAARRV